MKNSFFFKQFFMINLFFTFSRPFLGGNFGNCALQPMIGGDFLSEHLILTLGQDNVCFHRVLVAQWFHPMPCGKTAGNYFRLCKSHFKN